MHKPRKAVINMRTMKGAVLASVLCIAAEMVSAQYPVPNLAGPAYTNGPFARHVGELLVGQCTWYVYGRIQETGLILASTLSNKEMFIGHAKTWPDSARSVGFKVGTIAQTGSIAVWTNGTHGHVAFVESVVGGIAKFTECNSTPRTSSPNTVVVCRDSLDAGNWSVESREGAGLSYSANIKILPKYSTFSVVDGPKFVDGYYWYRLQGNGYDGWSKFEEIDKGIAQNPWLDNAGVDKDFCWTFTRIKLQASSTSISITENKMPQFYIYLTPPALSSQTITFKTLPAMALGNSDFTPGATASSGLRVTYTSSNEAVAPVIEGGLIRITGAGTTVITASQSGSTDFKAAIPVTQTLTVKARLTAEVPSGGGAVIGTGLYAPGTKVAMTAKPSAGNTFLRWEDGSQTTARSLTMPNANMAVVAWFGITANVSPPVIANPGAQRAMVGVPFDLSLGITSDGLPTVTVTGLPTGLKYDAAARTVKGVPTVSVTNRPVTIIAKNVSKTLALQQNFNLTVDPLPHWAQGNFNGWFGSETTDVGQVSADVTSQGKVTGRLLSLGTNYVFSAVSYARRDGDGAFWVSTTARVAKVAVPLTFAVRTPVGVNPPNLSAVDGWFATVADSDPVAKLYRNVWKEVGMAALVTNYIGYYTATLPGGGEYGSGYLAFTVDKSGGVKTVGKLADGMAVSLSGPLIIDDTGSVFAVLYTSPTAYKGGRLFGLAEFVKVSEGAKVIVRLLDDAPFSWASLSPTATPVFGEGFYRDLDLNGGWYDKLGNLYAYYMNKNSSVGTDADALAPGLLVGTNRYASIWWDPDGIALSVVTNKYGVMTTLSAPKAGAPVDPEKDRLWDYGVTNAGGLTIGLTRATGVFKGVFKAWFDYATTHASKTVSYEGVLTPEREDKSDGVEGRGFFLWADRTTPPVPLRPYGFNWSYDFKILQANTSRTIFFTPTCRAQQAPNLSSIINKDQLMKWVVSNIGQSGRYTITCKSNAYLGSIFSGGSVVIGGYEGTTTLNITSGSFEFLNVYTSVGIKTVEIHLSMTDNLGNTYIGTCNAETRVTASGGSGGQ